VTVRRMINYAARCLQMAAILTCIANAQERSQPPSVVVRQCSGCHATNGDSQLSYIPRLAGVSASYLESKLDMYRQAPTQPRNEILNLLLRHKDPDDAKITAVAASQMVGVAKAVSEADLKVAAQWYAAQPPAVAAHKTQSDSEGKTLFTQGIPAKNVPACQTCHGSDGQGTELGPRIAGQHAPYVLGQLQLFRDRARPSSPMTHVAQSLSDSNAEVIAKYLETL
jgi:cytochrome c553